MSAGLSPSVIILLSLVSSALRVEVVNLSFCVAQASKQGAKRQAKDTPEEGQW